MDHEYTSRKQEEKPEQKTAEEESSYGPSMAALASGAADPTPEQRGRSVDLPGAIRAKMENAFGADLTNLRLYESRAVADAGADAMSRGAEIAFAPGLIDFTGYQGQALLGHEVSHLVSQARGEVTGAGFLNDPALEARAEAEGAMAAAGEQVRMPTAALSPVTVAGTTGPIQAAHKQKDEEEKAPGGAPPAPAEASAPVAGPTAAPLPSMPQSRFLYSREYDETRGTLSEEDQQLYDQMMDEFLVHGLKQFSPLPTKERTEKNGYRPPTEEMFLNSGYDVTAGNGAGTKAYEKAFRQFRSDKKNWYSPTMQHHNEMVNKISAEQSRQYHQIFDPDPAPAQQAQAPAQQAQAPAQQAQVQQQGGAPPAPAEASAPVAGLTAAPLPSMPQSRFLYSREYDETRGTLSEEDQQLYDQMMDEFLVHGLKQFSPLPTKERTEKNGYRPPTEEMFLNSGYDVTAGNGAGTKAYEKAFRQFRSDKKNWYSPTMQHHNEMVNKISAEQSRQYHQIFDPDPAPAQQIPVQQAQGGGDAGMMNMPMMGQMMQDPQQNMIQQQQMTIQMLQAENTRLQSKIKEMESMMQAYKDKLGITQADDLTAQD